MATDVKIYSSNDFPAYLPKLNTLYDDLFSSGKGFRSKLISNIGGHLKLNQDQVKLLCQTIEFIHNASLLHDDLVDRSHLRRGKPAAWLKFTPEYAVLAGDYLLARVMVNLSNYGAISLIKYTSETISDLLEGEWLQDSLVGDWGVRLHQLDQVHKLKTASLFKWCFRSPFMIGGNDSKELHESLTLMGDIMGLLFQRSDDLLDFDIRNHENKLVLGDLQSNYINSFSAFILEKLPEEKHEPFRSCVTIDGVKQLVGKDFFDERVESFDQMNVKLIELYKSNLKALKDHNLENFRSFEKDMEKLPDLLYWRSK